MKKEKKVTNIITIRLDDELLEDLNSIAQREYRPLALQIRKILKDYVFQNGNSSSKSEKVIG